MKKELYEELSTDEISHLKEVPVEIDQDSLRVYEGVCPSCKKKLSKIIVNEELFNGAITIHIIKFRCETCKTEYLDLAEAQKYDLYVSLKKLEHKPLSNVMEIITGKKRGVVLEV